MSAQNASTPLLSADRPRSDPSEDLLGYASFAKMLAHSVLRGSPAAGLVVGIYGEWGLGKTTLLNFIEHYARADADDDAPIIVHFNPWWSSGREDLLRRFFKEFQAAVHAKKARNDKAKKAVLDALQKFGDAIANAPSALLATLGIPSWLNAPVGRAMAAFARTGPPPDIVGLKAELVGALSAEALRVIVLVDDIDRLLPSEMIDVFRLVRSVGDFPNVHYVLAFERQVVVKALTEECHTDGERYLEKIVQAPFDLPRPGAPTLQRLFTRRLDEVLAGTDEALFDAKYWSEVFLQGVAPFLRTPRDVTRIINALAVAYPAVKNEVNPVDFVAIETLRVFAPDAYDVIRSNRTRFVGMLLHMDHLRDENQRFHEQWLAGVQRGATAVHALVVRLFPQIAAVLAKSGGEADRDAMLRKARRVCTEQVFDVYFRYSLDRGLSRAAFLKLLECGPDELRAELERLSTEQLDDGHTKLRWFLEMLRDELTAGKGVTRTDLLTHLCSLGDAVIAGTPRAFTFEVPDDFLLVFVVEKLLEHLPATGRAPALRAALDAAGVSTVAMIVTFLGAQHGKYGEQPNPPDERTIPSEGDLKALEGLARERIERASAEGALWTAARFPRVLFDWGRLGGEVQAREAVAKWCGDDGNLLRLVESLRGPSERGRDSVNATALAALLDLEATAGRAKKLLAGPGVEPKVRDLLLLLLDAYASTAAAQSEQQARSRVLGGILGEIERTGSLPTMHWVRTTFEGDRPTIDRLAEEKLIQNVLGAQYMITLEGLRQARSDPRAERELRSCETLLTQLQASYRKDPKPTLDLEALAAQLNGQGTDALTLRRAALVLLVQLGAPRIQVKFGTDSGMPSTVTAGDGILDVSADEILGGKS